MHQMEFCEMSGLIGTESQSSQVARLIERDIVDGKLSPNSRLRSTRDLAGHFGVGHRVVLSALDILERKDLIIRVPRSGIHVKARGARRDVKEILFFALADHVEFHPVVQAVNNLVCQSGLNGRYDFFNRLVSSDNGTVSGRLETELARLADWGYVDCAIFYSRGFTRKTVEQCLKLPYPVIFVGDLPEGDYDDLQYTRLSSDTGGLFRTLTEYAAGKEHRRVMFFCPAKIESLPFFIEARKAMEACAEARGIELQTVFVPGIKPEEIRIGLDMVVKERFDEIRTMDMLSAYGIFHPGFDAGTLAAPLRFPEDIDMMNLSPSAGTVRIRHLRRDSTAFCARLCELLDNCNQLEAGRYRVPFDFEVMN